MVPGTSRLPYSHLVNKSRDAIFRYRQKGKSVDGLLYHRGRARQYDIISFEEPMDTEAGPFEEKASLREVLSDPAQPQRVTEERALANVLLDSLRENLSATENQALTLRLGGVPWREVGEIVLPLYNLFDRVPRRSKCGSKKSCSYGRQQRDKVVIENISEYVQFLSAHLL